MSQETQQTQQTLQLILDQLKEQRKFNKRIEEKVFAQEGRPPGESTDKSGNDEHGEKSGDDKHSDNFGDEEHGEDETNPWFPPAFEKPATVDGASMLKPKQH
eukprot:TRINITY_DN17741_c0_g1_i1.p3 TRINITY_DN17741_c0_g1~~TRINITY_DN17741_c0_g1_i1.p3  ORF type:complete len:102 (+),score=24.65 TRINITY_DN17741_c0_g1_i1:73-378(+)